MDPVALFNVVAVVLTHAVSLASVAVGAGVVVDVVALPAVLGVAAFWTGLLSTWRLWRLATRNS